MIKLLVILFIIKLYARNIFMDKNMFIRLANIERLTSWTWNLYTVWLLSYSITGGFKVGKNVSNFCNIWANCPGTPEAFFNCLIKLFVSSPCYCIVMSSFVVKFLSKFIAYI